MLVELYTRDGCPRCVTTKELLAKNNLQYTEQKIGVDIDRDAVLAKFPEARELPIVSVNGSSIPHTEVPTLIAASLVR